MEMGADAVGLARTIDTASIRWFFPRVLDAYTLKAFSLPARRWSLPKVCAALSILALPIDSLVAQTFRPVADVLWSQPANWGGTAPANDGTADLIFSQAGGPFYLQGTSTMDGNWNVHSITWNSAALSSGSVNLQSSGEGGLTLQSGLNNTSGGRVAVFANIALGSVQTWNDPSTPNTGGTLVVYGTISGAGGIQKTGSGTLVLSSSTNSYTGGTQINGSAVQATNAGSLGATSSAVTLNAGILRLGTNTAADISVTQPIILGASGGTLEATAGNTSFTGGISGTGALQFVPYEGMVNFVQSRFNLSGANPYSGGTTLGAVTLAVTGTAQALGTGAAILKDGAVLVLAAESNLGAGAKVALQPGSVLVVNSLSINPTHVIDSAPARTTGGTLSYAVDITAPLDMAAIGNGTLNLGSSGNVTYTASSIGVGAGGIYRLGGGSASLDAGTPTAKLIFAGTPNLFTGARSVSISGTGTTVNSDAARGAYVIFREANNYSGGTTVAGGALAVGNDAALGSGPVRLLSGSLNTDNGNHQISNSLIFQQADGASFYFGTTDTQFRNTLTINGPVDLGGTSHLFWGQNQGTKFLQPISNGALNLVGGSWAFGAANSFSGGLSLSNNAALDVSSDDQLGAAGSSLTFQDGILHAIVSFIVAHPLVTTTYGTTFNVDQRLTISGSVSGYGNITKKGAGTLIFTGGSQQIGLTDILSGVVQVNNGSSAGPISVEVHSGGTLGGNGTAGAIFLTPGGHLAPGTETPATLHLQSLSILKGCLLDFDLGLTLFDKIIVGNGYVQKQDGSAGPALVNLTDAGGLAVGQTFTLIDWSATGGQSYVTTDFALGNGPVRGDLTVIDRTLRVTITAVPEPASVGLFGALALSLVRRRRKQ